jgi:AraC-like DNA-binding protein
MKRISFNEFITFEAAMQQKDYAEQVKSSPCMIFDIPSQYGAGRIFTTPLIGGAGLVVMEACFDQDIEIYAEETSQESLSITMCLQGSLISHSQTHHEQTMKQHDTLFARYFDKQEVMSSRFKANEQNCFLTIQFSSDWLATADESTTLDLLTTPIWQGVYHSEIASQLMLSVAHEIVLATKQDELQHHYISAKVLELWSHQIKLLRRLSLSTEHDVVRLKQHDIASIHHAAEVLVEEMAEPPSILELSRRVSINDNKLKKGFKQVYGMTAFSYLQQQRLTKAKLLISEDHYSVMEVAAMVGFKSSSHFSKIFKQTFGVSPKQLRL